MKYIIRFLAIALPLALLLSCGNKNIDESKNLVINGGFEDSSDNLPKNWQTDVWEAKKRHVVFSVEEGSAHSGNKCVKIENFDDSDSKLFQRMDVLPNTVYRLSAWIRAEGVPEGQVGANLSVVRSLAVSKGFTNTDGKWQQVELYGKTGPAQTNMEVCCRIGVYGQEDKGTGWFDDFSVNALRSAPFGKQVLLFYEEQTQAKAEEIPQSIKDAQKKTNANFWIVLLSIAFIAAYFFIYAVFLKKDRFGFKDKTKKVLLTLILLLVFAFAIRMVMGYLIEGEEGDLACFKGWGNHAAEVQWSKYYDYFSAYLHERPHNTKTAQYWCDYPPVYIMLLALLAFIRNFFNLGSQMFTVLIKFPNIISDIVCCILIFKIAQRKLPEASALGLAILYAFNPAIIINSAVWGQADALYTMLALIIVEGILNDRYWLSGIVLGIAILIKIQTAFVAFALLFALAERKSLLRWTTTIAAGLGTFIILILPFAMKLPPDWIIVQLIGTLTGYPYSSVNAYNFFALFGANWKLSHEPFLFGISADTWGITLGYLLLVFAAFIYFFSKEKSKNYYSGLFAISVIFMFIPGMHERYLYAAIIFSLMAYVYEKDKRFLFLLLGYSITVFVNVYHILDVFIVSYFTHSPIPAYPSDPGLAYHISTFVRSIFHLPIQYAQDSSRNPVMLATSAANLLLFMYMFYVGVDIYILKKVKIMKEKKPALEPIPDVAGESVALNEAMAKPEVTSEEHKAEITKTEGASESISKTVESSTENIGAGTEVGIESGVVLSTEGETVVPPPLPRSKLRNILLALGIASVVIPIFSFIPWLIGRSELKEFPDDTKLRVAWALGVGIVVVIVTGIAFAALLYPGLKGSGYIK